MIGTATAQKMFGLDAFRSKFADGARSYLFYVTPIFPNISSINTDNEDYAYLVKSASLPQYSVSELSTNWQGNTYYAGGPQQFNTWNLEFHMDKNAKIYDKFVAWINYIHNPANGVHGDPTVYMVDQAVQLVDGVSGGATFIEAVELYGAFPTNIGDIRLDYGTKDWVTFSVTYRYQRHINISSLTNKNG